MPIGEVTLENVKFSFEENAKRGVPSMATGVKKCSKKGAYFYGVKKLVLKNVTFDKVTGEEIVTEKTGEIIKE